MRYVSYTEAMRRLGRKPNRHLFRHLCDRLGLEVIRFGGAVGIPSSDLPRLRAAYKEWDNRPRVVSRAKSAAR